MAIPCFYKMPEFFAQTGYSNPSDQKDGVFQYAKGFKGTLYDFLNTHPRENESFNHAMGGIFAQQATWVSIYPHETLVNSATDGSPILVDVAGGLGQDVEHFRAHYPHLADRLFLQDLPHVIALSKCPDPVHKMAHDFFTPQPVKGW